MGVESVEEVVVPDFQGLEADVSDFHPLDDFESSVDVLSPSVDIFQLAEKAVVQNSTAGFDFYNSWDKGPEVEAMNVELFEKLLLKIKADEKELSEEYAKVMDVRVKFHDSFNSSWKDGIVPSFSIEKNTYIEAVNVYVDLYDKKLTETRLLVQKNPQFISKLLHAKGVKKFSFFTFKDAVFDKEADQLLKSKKIESSSKRGDHLKILINMLKSETAKEHFKDKDLIYSLLSPYQKIGMKALEKEYPEVYNKISERPVLLVGLLDKDDTSLDVWNLVEKLGVKDDDDKFFAIVNQLKMKKSSFNNDLAHIKEESGKYTFSFVGTSDLRTELLSRVEERESMLLLVPRMIPILGEILDLGDSVKYSYQGNYYESLKSLGWCAAGVVTLGSAKIFKIVKMADKIKSIEGLEKAAAFVVNALQMGVGVYDGTNVFEKDSDEIFVPQNIIPEKDKEQIEEIKYIEYDESVSRIVKLHEKVHVDFPFSFDGDREKVFINGLIQIIEKTPESQLYFIKKALERTLKKFEKSRAGEFHLHKGVIVLQDEVAMKLFRGRFNKYLKEGQEGDVKEASEGGLDKKEREGSQNSNIT